MPDVKINKVLKSRIDEVDFSNLIFGKEFSDHIFLAEFNGSHWENCRIQPYGAIPLSPSLSCMHYGQAIFEGLKAHRNIYGEVQIFRPYDNWARMNEGAKRMCMPEIPKDIFVGGLKTLCRLDEQWIPESSNASLYLRPFLIASDEYLGIRPSTNYLFMIYGCAVGTYYTSAIKVKVETEFVRACRGGVGEAKTAGNYAAALYATQIANGEGFQQVLWTDAIEHKYLEELGSSNFFVRIGDTLITPETAGTVLKGITRDSVIQLAKKAGYKVEERKISIDELLEADKYNRIEEMFATGTAVNIIQISELGYKDRSIKPNAISAFSMANALRKQLDDIKYSRIDDIFEWNEKTALQRAVMS